MKKVLVISFSNLKTDPRVYRQILFLKSVEDFDITAVGYCSPDISGLNSISIKKVKGSITSKLTRGFQLKSNQFEKYYWTSPPVKESLNKLKDNFFDLIIANDINTLPLVVFLAKKNGAKVLLDAHEYQPRQFDDRWLFRFFFQDYWDYICRTYLPKADAMVTVCQGIAEEYSKNYGIECGVLTNAPFQELLKPSPVDDQSIRMIYHGFLNSSRKIENMLYLMDLLDERFSLDLMVIPNQGGYLQKLQKLVSIRKRISFREPVPMPQISRALNEYDIGLFLLWPASFNYRLALPNKLFEYIQGCLAVAIWPSQEMVRVVHEYNCGVVSDDFTLESMAKVLNNLSTEEIKKFKENSRIASPHLCAEKNRDILLDTVASLISD
ncbi:hypothetical protein [Acaryochloris marina]|uniref:hypothetical protein n=1 Tax=Acaryochloris marina TaxID=155978 RepID=UPI001BB036B6|nr:hypothetical protein [Acaryochloris marina]QUY44700.1 capsular biosynthesis protein [Acaryochloris marina S15]